MKKLEIATIGLVAGIVIFLSINAILGTSPSYSETGGDRFGKIGSVECKRIKDNCFSIWNPVTDTAVRDPIISVDNGSVSVIGVAPEKKIETGDNYVKLKGDLIGRRSKIFEKGLYKNHLCYTEIVVEVHNATKITVDDLWGEKTIVGGQGMEKAVINLSE